MSLFDDLPDPVTESKPLKRQVGDGGDEDGPPADKRPLIDLIDLLVGTAAEKGERTEMQDTHLNIPDFVSKVAAGAYSGEAQRISLFGVFDGHGGARAAHFAKQRIMEQLSAKFPSGDLAQIEKDIKRILLDVYKKTDEEFLREASRQRPHWKDGSTATTVLLVNNTLYIANIGDSAVCNISNVVHFVKSASKLFLLPSYNVILAKIVCFQWNISRYVFSTLRSH
uniref:PPM-type phosphatase domain-containing protein n=1 Tax=Mesocestoides corti TaxID=53468 RepID=A0A5K3FMP8_MESCO